MKLEEIRMVKKRLKTFLPIERIFFSIKVQIIIIIIIKHLLGKFVLLCIVYHSPNIHQLSFFYFFRGSVKGRGRPRHIHSIHVQLYLIIQYDLQFLLSRNVMKDIGIGIIYIVFISLCRDLSLTL